MPDKPQPRIARAVIGSSILAMYLLFIRQVFLLRTLLVTPVADCPETGGPDLGWFNVLRFKVIYLGRYFFRRQTLWEGWLRRVEAATIRRLESQGAKKNVVVPIAEVQAEGLDPERFYQDYVLKGRAVVVRGGARMLPAFQRWDLSHFQNYADDHVWISDRDKGNHYYGRLGEVLSAPGEGRKLYLYASTDLLRDHAELIKDLDVSRFRSMLSRTPIGHVGSQLFLGTDRGSGSGWHCAAGSNMFLMIRGSKRWRFIHPDQTWCLYPLMQTTAQNMLTPLTLLQGKPLPPEWVAEHVPLFAYSRQSEVVLQPGDALFNPAWNWHTVENLTDESVAVASRWVPPVVVSYNRFAEAAMLFSRAVWRRRFQALKNGGLALSDDDMRGHAQDMDHRVDFGRPGAHDRLVRSYGISELVAGQGGAAVD